MKIMQERINYYVLIFYEDFNKWKLFPKIVVFVLRCIFFHVIMTKQNTKLNDVCLPHACIRLFMQK